jgi:site-specific recombinase XerD
MILDSKGRTHRYAMQRLGVIRRYLRTLRDAGLLKLESLSELGHCAAGASLESLVSALQAGDPHTALAALTKPPPPPGPLAAHIDSYLKLHRALGKQYRSNRYDLLHLDRFLQQQAVSSVHEVTPEIIEQWTKPMKCIAVVRARKTRLVQRFFDYLAGIRVLECNPVAQSLLDAYRRPSTSIKPYIFSTTQIKAILAEARNLPRTGLFPLRPETCHTMIAILYGLGLRCGEACRLRLRDLDLSQQALFIRETKFHKSRYVPFGPKVGRCLEDFLHVRRRYLAPVKVDDPLFVTLWRAPIHDNTIRDPFTQILHCLGINGGREKRMPRLHDLRHSFAVHRLTRWYREGVDVQSRLPLLSTFLGHADVKNTQVYLTATDELLLHASERFSRQFEFSLEKESLA